MKKIDLNFKLTDLEGVEIEDAKKFVASILLAEKTNDSVKYFDWAMTLNKVGVIEVDESDVTKIKTAIQNAEQYNNLIKGQLLKYIQSI